MYVTTLKNLLQEVKFEARGVDLNTTITYISHDTRDIPSTGTPLFFAIKGQHVDANSLIGDVLRRNSQTIVISSSSDLSRGILVDDLPACMALVARKFYQDPDDKMKVVTVTGTNGKTTVGFVTRHLLNTQGKTGLLGTIEYDLGGETIEAVNTTPLALDFYKYLSTCVNNGCQNLVFEASSHAIDQKRISGVKLDVAIFTNLSREHLDYHKTLDKYFQVKIQLFDGDNGQRPGVSLVNIDDHYGTILVNVLHHNRQNVLTFGEDESADFRIGDITEYGFDGVQFSLTFQGKKYMFKTQMIGKHNVFNITASIAAAHCLGCKFEDMQNSLPSFKGVPGRLEKIALKNGALAFIDFAHTPDALRAILGVLRKHSEKRVVTLFGCGGDRDRSKRVPMTGIVTTLSDHTIMTADNPRSEPLSQILSDMQKGITSGSHVEIIENRRRAIDYAVHFCKPGDVLLIAGRGHENYQKIGDRLIRFNDKEVVEEANKTL